MTPLRALILFLLMTTSPALAHEGTHVHPHGADTWLLIALIAAVVVGCATLLRHRK
ncbi:peptidase M23 [Phaeobacter sp. C3_T13_0]|uniref:peptidase M23 n=1 Tax=Phaeobacter cretensis TaxID=3342641 RepID=UPI0039BD5620